jgi:flagella basal body P-ring formation protein FlgA
MATTFPRSHARHPARTARRGLVAVAALALGLLAGRAADAPAIVLQASALADSQGVFVAQVITNTNGLALPQLRLADAPAIGQTLTLTRAQVRAELERLAPALAWTNWSGAAAVRVARRTRILDETELKDLLVAALQRDAARDRGEVELQLGRGWKPVPVPDEPFVLKLLDLPSTGLSPSLILRFQFAGARETLGPWQLNVQTRLWREALTARVPLLRGQPLSEADVVRERVDAFLHRGALADIKWAEGPFELTENLAAGAPISARSLRPRTVVLRGQIVDAVVRQGAMAISLKVEALENGAAGQTVRVRNIQTKRELRGKVVDEQSVLVPL